MAAGDDPREPHHPSAARRDGEAHPVSGRPTVAALIPARWASSRFPGKALAPIAGKPMIQHVVERVRQCRALDDVIVATDDERIASAVEAAGATVAMTGEAHSGGDRIAQVARKHPEFDLIVNVQGDEPLIDPAVIDAVLEPLLGESPVQVVTAARTFADDEDIDDPNRVKVVCRLGGEALYFSRSRIPHGRDHAAEPLLHIGIYAYRREALLAFAELPPTPLERAEALEQLRLLEHGVPIQVVRVDWRGVAVDAPEDVALVEAQLGGA